MKLNNIIKASIIIFATSLTFKAYAAATPSRSSVSSSIDDYTIATELYQPYNFDDNGKIVGISTEILDKVLQIMEARKTANDVVLLPWARGYAQVQQNSNFMLYSMTRTAERENLFKWAGPIVPTKNTLIARKSDNIKINNLEDIKKYKIGVVRSDIGESLVKQIGVPEMNLSAASSAEQNIRKLLTGRIDLFSYEDNTAFWVIRDLGESTKDFEVVYTFQSGDLYYAFNKNTPDELINKFQEALDKVKSSPDYQQIINKYLK